jgi:hypothetical protein
MVQTKSRYISNITCFVYFNPATHGHLCYLYLYLIIKEVRFLPKFSSNFLLDNFYDVAIFLIAG